VARRIDCEGGNRVTGSVRVGIKNEICRDETQKSQEWVLGSRERFSDRKGRDYVQYGLSSSRVRENKDEGDEPRLEIDRAEQGDCMRASRESRTELTGSGLTGYVKPRLEVRRGQTSGW